MSEMIERVALALAEHDGKGLDGIIGGARYRSLARAALLALSEVSDEFLDTVDFYDGEHSRSGETYPVQRNFLRSFVDASLRSPGQGGE